MTNYQPNFNIYLGFEKKFVSQFFGVTFFFGDLVISHWQRCTSIFTFLGLKNRF